MHSAKIALSHRADTAALIQSPRISRLLKNVVEIFPHPAKCSRYTGATSLVLALGCGLSPAFAEMAEDSAAVAPLTAQADVIAQEFSAALKQALLGAMAQGGAVRAVSVCAQVAPALAQATGEKWGWQIRRVSTKARNISSAIPDTWEAQVLAQFEQRLVAGEAPGSLSHAQTIAGEFRYMKAQIAEPLCLPWCLQCHGSAIDPAVAQLLQTLYPADRAQGYAAGQLRGALSLRYAADTELQQ